MPELKSFVSIEELDALVAMARREDLGPAGVDATSEVTIPADLMGEATMVARQPGVVAGLALLDRVVAAYDPAVELQLLKRDGDTAIQSGSGSLAVFRGKLRSILAIERVALNFVTRLSGIATLTRRYVDAIANVEGSRARIYDTRKTLPGWRGLEKYAVAAAGGATHRVGLYDAVLIKDNHIAHVSGAPGSTLSETVARAAREARERFPQLKFVEVEVDTLEQLQQVLATGVDIVLLDNMAPATLREAVAMRDARAPQVELEASGGVNLDTVAAIAATGVERISVGALTHSAIALDVGLDILG